MTERKTDVRALLRLGWFGLLGAVLFFWSYPVNIGLLRLFLVTALPALLLGASALLWRRKRARLVPLGVLGLVMLALLAPGRALNVQRLRSCYVAALRRYESVRYIWGGENRFGIDCSGLVRRGLINAHLREGLRRLNPTHIRSAFSLWWYDCSARALKDEYRNWTRFLFAADSINGIDPARLAPGDLAVTHDGVHVLVHLGDGEWLEADPALGQVFRGRVPVENGWFRMPASVLRWRRLE